MELSDVAAEATVFIDANIFNFVRRRLNSTALALWCYHYRFF